MNRFSPPTCLFPLIQEGLNRQIRPRLERVINATGVVIHTNLGRSPLHPSALRHLIDISRAYSNLEYDLERGERGNRYACVEEILCRLTGAESALVVNNNAGAVLLTLNALAEGREVIVSTGGIGRDRRGLSNPGCHEAKRGPAQGGRNNEPDPPHGLSKGDWTSNGAPLKGSYQQFQNHGFYLRRFDRGPGSSGQRASTPGHGGPWKRLPD